MRNFGQIMVEFAKAVPDGIVCFFPSYLYMESIVSMWNDMVSYLHGASLFEFYAWVLMSLYLGYFE